MITKEQAIEALNECLRGGGGYGTVLLFIEQANTVPDEYDLGLMKEEVRLLTKVCRMRSEKIAQYERQISILKNCIAKNLVMIENTCNQFEELGE